MNGVLVAVGGAKGSRACARLFADRPPNMILIGRPAEEIVRAAAEYEVDLIVIGNTRGPIDKLILGDVAHRVASTAPVPVLLAR